MVEDTGINIYNLLYDIALIFACFITISLLSDIVIISNFCHYCSLLFPGQLQIVHEKVQTQKEHYLNYRKFILDDDSDVFATGGSKASKGTARARTTLATAGPPPFGSTFAQKSTMASIFAALQATQTPANNQPQVSQALSTKMKIFRSTEAS